MSMIRVLEGSTIWPYSLGQLRADEPARSFSMAPSDAELAEYGVFRVQAQAQPAYDPATHRVVEVRPIEQGSTWLQQWELEDLTDAERAAYYRATHPPRWFEFATVLQQQAEIKALLRAALDVEPPAAMALPVGLARASDGDSRVFLAAWQAARQAGLISDELVAQVQGAGVAHDLPAEFIAGLGGPELWAWPEAPERFQRWTAPDGSVWVYDQPRNELGQYLADDPDTEEVESALQWLPEVQG